MKILLINLIYEYQIKGNKKIITINDYYEIKLKY
jgi:hypothetical protein